MRVVYYLLIYWLKSIFSDEERIEELIIRIILLSTRVGGRLEPVGQHIIRIILLSTIVCGSLKPVRLQIIRIILLPTRVSGSLELIGR